MVKKARFIFGLIFVAIAIACCVFGAVLIVPFIGKSDASMENIALIVAFPVALMVYGAQIVSGIISVGCLAGYYRCPVKSYKVAAILFSVLHLIMLIFSVLTVFLLTRT
ncbi:MAG: hypothetical protein SOT34_02215 [Candidatus Borkfalkiaceae bacterium]|nr:hypothetical protein [Christensenellaceae bacterium]